MAVSRRGIGPRGEAEAGQPREEAPRLRGSAPPQPARARLRLPPAPSGGRGAAASAGWLFNPLNSSFLTLALITLKLPRKFTVRCQKEHCATRQRISAVGLLIQVR